MFAGFGVLVQLFMQGHDVVGVKEESEEVVEKLQSSGSADLALLSVVERRKVLKNSKAMTPLQFGIAGFTNFTWGVTVGAWDEILNQLLFFLSL